MLFVLQFTRFSVTKQPVCVIICRIAAHISSDLLIFNELSSCLVKKQTRQYWNSGVIPFKTQGMEISCRSWREDGGGTYCWVWWMWRPTTPWSKPISTPPSPASRSVHHGVCSFNKKCLISYWQKWIFLLSKMLSFYLEFVFLFLVVFFKSHGKFLFQLFFVCFNWFKTVFSHFFKLFLCCDSLVWDG